MTNKPESAVEAVAIKRWRATGDYAYPSEECADGEFVDFDDPQSALDALRGEVRDLTADRDSWMDQAEERVRNWHEEHEARLAAERRVAELEANDRRYRFLRDGDGEVDWQDAYEAIGSAFTGSHIDSLIDLSIERDAAHADLTKESP